MKKRVKVRLKEDVDEYEGTFLAGSEWFTSGKNCQPPRHNGYVSIKFPKRARDVHWSLVEIIDKEYLQEMAETEKRLKEEYKSASKIKEFIGPRGGFKMLQFIYTTSEGELEQYSNVCKRTAQKELEYLKELGLKIEIKIIQ